MVIMQPPYWLSQKYLEGYELQLINCKLQVISIDYMLLD